jgi:hypothetical protein
MNVGVDDRAWPSLNQDWRAAVSIQLPSRWGWPLLYTLSGEEPVVRRRSGNAELTGKEAARRRDYHLGGCLSQFQDAKEKRVVVPATMQCAVAGITAPHSFLFRRMRQGRAAYWPNAEFPAVNADRNFSPAQHGASHDGAGSVH